MTDMLNTAVIPISMFIVTMGYVFGSLSASWASKGFVETGLIPFSAVASSITMFALPFVHNGWLQNIGNEKAWKDLFRYSASCKDTASQPINLNEDPQIHDNGQQWKLIIENYSLKAGFCLFTDPSATYEDLAGNTPCNRKPGLPLFQLADYIGVASN